MSKNDDIGPSRGLTALMHKTVMFLLYPFRKPIAFVILLVVLGGLFFGLPVFLYGVNPKQVHNWYLEKYQELDVKAISSNLSEIVKPKVEQKGIDQLVDLPQDIKYQPSRRQSFGRAATGSNTHQVVDVLAENANDVVSVDSIERADENQYPLAQTSAVSQPVSAQRVEKTTDSKGFVSITKEKADTSLQYLAEQKEVIGEAKVINANELIVDNIYIFLHGIYSNPQNQRGVKAGVFLKSALKGETVRCDIIAYTEDHAATAECFVGNVSINRIMVEKGYSDKVSLK